MTGGANVSWLTAARRLSAAWINALGNAFELAAGSGRIAVATELGRCTRGAIGFVTLSLKLKPSLKNESFAALKLDHSPRPSCHSERSRRISHYSYKQKIL